MNLRLYKHIVRDGCDGLKQNIGAGLAASALIGVAMILIGVLLFARVSLSDGMAYLQSQIAMKVYVDASYETTEVASILRENKYIESITVETGEETLQKLTFFFAGKEHLLQSFQNSHVEDSITLQLHNPNHIAVMAKELEGMESIIKVVYPQQFAQTIFDWSNAMETYGVGLTFFFLIMAFGMVYLSIRLSLYRRQKEIKVKLLIGAKPSTVRGQFLFEGACMGFVGSLFATLVVYGLYRLLVVPIEERFPFLFSFNGSTISYIFIGMICVGICIGVLASYVCTRKLIKDV